MRGNRCVPSVAAPQCSEVDLADTTSMFVDTDKDFRYWSSVAGLSGETRANILRADIVVVPYEGFRDHPGPLFPAGTAELFQFLKDNLPSGNEAELAVEDEDFRELSLHYDLVTIASCVVKAVAEPIVVKLMADWIAKRLGNRLNSSEVRASLTIVHTDGDQSKSVQFSYDGPAATFETVVKDALDKVPSAIAPTSPNKLERSVDELQS
jgi:hypothetical protein